MFAGGILAALIWKVFLLWIHSFPFNSDEAIVALMARHILQGELPIFFYGQAYMGSLDAFLTAAGFSLFGEQVAVIRGVQILLYIGILLTTFWLSILIFRSQRAALFSVFLLTIPTVNMTLYTTVSLGGYGEALLIGNLIVCIGLVVGRRFSESFELRRFFPLLLLWGILAGLGLWANGLTLVYSLPVGIWLLAKIFRFFKFPGNCVCLLSILIGVGIGAFPWMLYAAQNTPAQLVNELLGSAVAVEKSSWILQVLAHLVNFILLGIPVTLGFRPPWEIRWLILPLIPFVAVFWFLVIRFAYRDIKNSDSGDRQIKLIPVWVAVTLVSLFILTHFGVDPSGRYFLPLSIVLALFGGAFLEKGISKNLWVWIGIVLVVGYQFLGTLQCVFQHPSGLTTQFDATTVIDHRYDQELIDFLTSHGETRGFSNYWVGYPLAFLSQENIIFTPRLPYHLDLRYTPRDDRYAPYDAIVNASDRIALITTNNPNLDDALRNLLTKRQITWQERIIGDYRVYFDLSGPIYESDFDFENQP